MLGVMGSDAPALVTFGHGTASAERIAEPLNGAGVAGIRLRDDGLLGYDEGQGTLL